MVTECHLPLSYTTNQINKTCGREKKCQPTLLTKELPLELQNIVTSTALLKAYPNQPKLSDVVKVFVEVSVPTVS